MWAHTSVQDSLQVLSPFPPTNVRDQLNVTMWPIKAICLYFVTLWVRSLWSPFLDFNWPCHVFSLITYHTTHVEHASSHIHTKSKRKTFPWILQTHNSLWLLQHQKHNLTTITTTLSQLRILKTSIPQDYHFMSLTKRSRALHLKINTSRLNWFKVLPYETK